jgi:hypothetical protein
MTSSSADFLPDFPYHRYSVSTLLTLLVIPVLYYAYHYKADAKSDAPDG